MSIKEKIEALQRQIEDLSQEIQKLQAECPHTKYMEGITMIGCIQPILICVECGQGKPIDFSKYIEFEA